MLVQLFLSAFAMGILGSFHCVGMCGPLALSLPLKNDTNGAKISGILLYNVGRVCTYAAFGTVFGLIGQSMAFFGWQQVLSITIGALIIFFVLFSKQLTAISTAQNRISRMMEFIRRQLGKLFQNNSNTSLFSIGLLNGLLPCGLVYLAAAGALATNSLVNSIVFMACFGLGTMPAMFAVAFFGSRISFATRQSIRKVFPVIMVVMGALLIVRGMGLGIPYLSPHMNIEAQSIDCCHRHP